MIFISDSVLSRIAENTSLGSVGLRGLSVPDVAVRRHIISSVVISGGVGDADTRSL